jgi:hypothetical protein
MALAVLLPVLGLSAARFAAPSPRAAVAYAAAPAVSPKDDLLAAVEAYNAATKADSVPSVDFGVSGGELDADSRAPRDLLAAGAYYAVSPAVGAAADRVIASVDAVAATNPTAEPTAGFGAADGATSCKLHGRWFNAFTTAADATFSADSKRGGVRKHATRERSTHERRRTATHGTRALGPTHSATFALARRVLGRRSSRTAWMRAAGA